jgi:hypothetical protein
MGLFRHAPGLRIADKKASSSFHVLKFTIIAARMMEAERGIVCTFIHDAVMGPHPAECSGISRTVTFDS